MISLKDAMDLCGEFVDWADTVEELISPFLWSRHIQAVYKISEEDYIYVMNLMAVTVYVAVGHAMLDGIEQAKEANSCGACRNN